MIPSSLLPTAKACLLRACLLVCCLASATPAWGGDYLRDVQKAALRDRRADWGHWGPKPDRYSSWQQHTNRLIPIYTFGISLDSFRGDHSEYRDPRRLRQLYGRLPERTLNPEAQYFDQTAVYRLQQQAVQQGKKYVIVLIFDGMDWQTTQAAAAYYSGRIGPREGRLRGLHFLDYRATTTDFGYFVTSPHNHGTRFDVNTQTISNVGGQYPGGYAADLGGATPWTPSPDPLYIIGQSAVVRHAFTDSAASATAMFAGVKTYNRAVNVDAEGNQVVPIARTLQAQGRAIGIVTSVPISHATPACAYGNNVARYDYQDLTRDLLGLPSVAHPSEPLPGVDVLLGAGWGHTKEEDKAQGTNFVPGNVYLPDAVRRQVDQRNGGRYVVVERRPGVSGGTSLMEAARTAAQTGARLLGFFGVGDQRGSHLPYRTADGRFNPTSGVRSPLEAYQPADIFENPTLADMTRAALERLQHDPDGFWLMVESGDVDWANHTNNIDNTIGAVKSGDEAFRVIVEWVERRHAWDETALIVTADHGHYLVLDRPELLIPPSRRHAVAESGEP